LVIGLIRRSLVFSEKDKVEQLSVTVGVEVNVHWGDLNAGRERVSVGYGEFDWKTLAALTCDGAGKGLGFSSDSGRSLESDLVALLCRPKVPNGDRDGC
jgi:hypothetical protein